MAKSNLHPFYSSKEIKKALEDIFDLGDWWKYKDKRTTLLEEKFSRNHNSKYGISVCNGTVALDVILKAIGIKKGEEIILPAYDFYSLPKSVINSGAVPVFADVCRNNFTIDFKELEQKISKKTKALVAVHISSSVGEMDKISQLARENKIFLIEDCAQAHGATYGNQKVGSWGDVGLFSFGGIKLMTSGQGGMVITSNEELYKKIFAIVNRGFLPDNTLNKFGIIGENYQLSELQAALLLPQLDMLNKYCQKREEASKYLDTNLKGIPGITILDQFEKTSIRAQMRYSFCLNEKALSKETSKEKFIRILKEKGYPIMGGYSSIRSDERLHGFFKKGKDFPNAHKAEEEIVSLHHTFLLNEFNVLDELIKDVTSIINN